MLLKAHGCAVTYVWYSLTLLCLKYKYPWVFLLASGFRKSTLLASPPPHAWFSAWPGILCHGPECLPAGWFPCHPLWHPRAKPTQSCKFRCYVPTFGQLQSHDMWLVYRNLNSEISALKSIRGSAALWNCLGRLALHSYVAFCTTERQVRLWQHF